MTMKHSGAKKIKTLESFYSSFDQLNGLHPWMEAVKEGFITYRVRELQTGKVAYFNFMLAKEMGLIAADHPHQMNDELEKQLIKSFSLQIINEYDELSQRKIDPKTIRPHRHMATRYLQLQHANKQGKTSGDGRGIWNGVVQNRGVTWDVSSRGTGVTCLSPGAVEAQRPLKTGGTEFGYGCGLAEIDELLAASILAETIHLQGIRTERVLCIIDLGKGYGIGVRAAHNLIRPAHIFLYLKQEEYAAAKAATDYLIDRQVANKVWNINTQSKEKYDELLKYMSHSFADFAALLEVDYVFTWLDWDGDNVLADAGIIDYGSVRQFGIRHDKYRYDDVQRFSTNLNEQKQKARLIVQVFAQLVDFLKTKKKKPLRQFAHHPQVLEFNKHFNNKKSERLLYRMGFSEIQRARILSKKKLFQEFKNEFFFLERTKISGTEEKVADGVNHPALFNMRKLLREYPAFLAKATVPFHDRNITVETFFNMAVSGYAKSQDKRSAKKWKIHSDKFQRLYRQLLVTAADGKNPETFLKSFNERAKKLNSDTRITGNALVEIVDVMITEKKKGLSLEEFQKVIDRFVFDHSSLPESDAGSHYKDNSTKPAVKFDLFAKLLSLVEENKESI